MIETYYREAELETGASPDAALRVLIDVIVHWRHGRRGVADQKGWMRFDVGSQLDLRMWGAWGSSAWKRMPIAIEARVHARPAGSLVELKLTSDPGPYLTALPIVGRLYDTAFGAVVDSVTSGLAAAAAGWTPPVDDAELADPDFPGPPVPGSVNRMLLWAAPSIVALAAAIALGASGDLPQQVATSLAGAAATIGIFMAFIGLAPSIQVGGASKVRWRSVLGIAVILAAAGAIATFATWLLTPAFVLPVALALGAFLVIQLAWCLGRVVIESRAAKARA